MRQIGIALLGVMFLMLGHVNAYSTTGGLGYTSYDLAYSAYMKVVRTKVGDNMSKKLDVGEEGTVSLNFDLSSDGKLIQVNVNNDKTKASPKMISMAIMAVKQSSPFDPFPETLAKNNKLTFDIELNLKPANAKL